MKLNILTNNYSHHYFEDVERWHLCLSYDAMHLHVYQKGKEERINILLGINIELPEGNSLYNSLALSLNQVLEQDCTCISFNIPKLEQEANSIYVKES